jgi:hypothetical protein
VDHKQLQAKVKKNGNYRVAGQFITDLAFVMTSLAFLASSKDEDFFSIIDLGFVPLS